MGWDEVGETVCPVARTLAVVGDRWTLLILRECFLGTKRFEDFQKQTGMSSHLLSTRLKRLVGDGVVSRQLYSRRPRRYEYRLTIKGLDLYPLLLGLKAWGEKWGGFAKRTEPALVIVHKSCGEPTGLDLRCESCGEHFGARDASVRLGEDFVAERKARHDVA